MTISITDDFVGHQVHNGSTKELISVCVQEEDIRAERAHLTVAPPKKKDNNSYKKFKPQRRNNQSNTHNLSSSPNAPNKGSKK